MVISVKEFHCNFLRTGCFIAGSLAGLVIPFETPFLLMWQKNVKKLMWLVKLQSTYLEAEKLCCISIIGSKYCQEKRILGHWWATMLSTWRTRTRSMFSWNWCHILCPTSAWRSRIRDPSHHATLTLTAKDPLSIFSGLWKTMNMVVCVHEPTIPMFFCFWSTFGGGYAAQPAYWLTWPSHSIGWSLVLMFAVIGCIRYSWILWDTVHSDFTYSL